MEQPVIDIASIVNDPKLTEVLTNKIEGYRKTRSGGRYKRTPLDDIDSNGNFNANYLIDEFLKVTVKKSQLPRAQRDAIVAFVGEAMHVVWLSNKRKENENGNKEESRG